MAETLQTHASVICLQRPSLPTALYAEYIMRNLGLDEAQAGIKIAGTNINNLRYADDTTLMEESEEELTKIRERGSPRRGTLRYSNGLRWPNVDGANSLSWSFIGIPHKPSYSASFSPLNFPTTLFLPDLILY